MDSWLALAAAILVVVGLTRVASNVCRHVALAWRRVAGLVRRMV